MNMYSVVLKRFARAFVAGGVSNMVAIVAVTQSFSNLKDLQTWAFSLVVAFTVGGVMALDKALRYE